MKLFFNKYKQIALILFAVTGAVATIPVSASALPPEIVGSAAMDTDIDGYIDRIELTMTEAILDNNPVPGFTVIDNDGSQLLVTMVDIDDNDSSIMILSLDDSLQIGTTGPPVLSYVTGISPEVQNIAGEVMAAVSGYAVGDSAAPVIRSYITHPVNTDGNLMAGTTITVQFSEDMGSAVPSNRFTITDNDLTATYDGSTDANWPDGAQILYGYGENMVRNSSFERTTVNSSLPDGWIVGANHILETASSSSRYGSYSLKVPSGSAGFSATKTRDFIPVRPGAEHILSAWVFISSGTGLSGDGYAYIDLDDGAGQTVDSTLVGTPSGYRNWDGWFQECEEDLSGVPENIWTHIQCVFTPTKDLELSPPYSDNKRTTGVKVRFVTDNTINGDIWIDDIRIEEKPADNPTQFTATLITPTMSVSESWTVNATLTGFTGAQDPAGNPVSSTPLGIAGIDRTSASPVFERYAWMQDSNGNTISSVAYPKFVDLDSDGDLDMVVWKYNGSTSTGNLLYYENTGTPEYPVWTAGGNLQTSDGQDIEDSGYGGATFFDYDNDGDPDMFLQGVKMLRNTGTIDAPVWALPEPLTWKDYSGTDQPIFGSQPTFLDIDKDGDMDLITIGGGYGCSGVGTMQTCMLFFENIADDPVIEPEYKFYRDMGDDNNDGCAAGECYVWASRVVDVDGNYINAKSFVFSDMDNDRDLDLIAFTYRRVCPGGSCYRELEMRYYRNDDVTADRSHPLFVHVDQNTWLSNGLILDRYGDDISFGYFNLADIDNDGDPDLVLVPGFGASSGLYAADILYYYENKGDDSLGPTGIDPAITVSSSVTCGLGPDVTGTDAQLDMSAINTTEMKISNYLLSPTQETRYPDPACPDDIACDRNAPFWQSFDSPRNWILPTYPANTMLKVYVNFRDQNGFRSPRYFDEITFYEPTTSNVFIPSPVAGSFTNDTLQPVSLSINYSGGVQSPAEFTMTIKNYYAQGAACTTGVNCDEYVMDLNSPGLVWDASSVLTFTPAAQGIAFTEGRLEVIVTGKDQCGNFIEDNSGNPYYTWIFYLDTTGPSSTITTAGGYNYNNWDSTDEITGTALEPQLATGEDGSGLDIIEISIIKNGGEYWSFDDWDNWGDGWVSPETWDEYVYYNSSTTDWYYDDFPLNWLANYGSIADGDTFTITVRTYDNAGNLNNPAAVSAILWDISSPDAPQITSASAPASDSVLLTWDIPDPNGGVLDSYDIRYTEGGTFGPWASAVEVTGEPSPGTPGAGQNHTITGLDGNTSYCFSMTVSDTTGNQSPRSNALCASTTPDSAAPAAINLTVAAVTSDTVRLVWIAPGDDDDTGQAAAYDIGYKFNNGDIIDDNDFAANAVHISGIPAPQAAGSPEAFNVTGLSAGYYSFAIKTADEVPLWSSLSNIENRTITVSDNIDPGAISDLVVLTEPADGFLFPSKLTLRWTSPGDDWVDIDGDTVVDAGEEFGTASLYDIRYSKVMITDSNWDNAEVIPAQGEPAPDLHGAVQTYQVTGLETNVRYYFAVKTSDEMGNESDLSNIAEQRTSMFMGYNMVTISKPLSSNTNPGYVLGGIINPQMQYWKSTWDGDIANTPDIEDAGDWVVPDSIVPGQGYYLSLTIDHVVLDPAQVNGGGTEPGYVINQLTTGWNLFGNPFGREVRLEDIRILPETGGEWRRTITITNQSSTSDLLAGHTVNFSFNHSDMVISGESLASGDDIRILYCLDIACVQYKDIDRVVSDADCPDGQPAAANGWNCSAAEVFFAAQADISPDGLDSDYRIEYGNPTPPAPEAEINNVYIFYDDFDNYIYDNDLLKYKNNLIFNSGFESGLFGWDAIGSGVIEFDANTVQWGNRSVHISNLSENIIKNGTFEEERGNTYFWGWAAPGGGGFIIDTDNVYSDGGLQSALLRPGDIYLNPCPVTKNYSYLTDYGGDFSFKPYMIPEEGDEIIVSFWYKTSLVSDFNGPENTGRVYVMKTPVSSVQYTPEYDPETALLTIEGPDTTDWTYFENRYTVTGGDFKLYFVIEGLFERKYSWGGCHIEEMGVGDKVWFDNVQVRIVESQDSDIGVKQNVSGLATGTYTLSGYMKTNMMAGTAHLDVYNEDTGEIYIDISGDDIDMSGNQDWTAVETQVDIPQNLDNIYIRCHADGIPIGDLWCDGLKLEEGGAASPYEERGWVWWNPSTDYFLPYPGVGSYSVTSTPGFLEIYSNYGRSIALPNSPTVPTFLNVNNTPAVYIPLPDDNDYVIEAKEDASGMWYSGWCQQGLTFIRDTNKEGAHNDDTAIARQYMNYDGANWHNKGYFGTWSDTAINPNYTRLRVAFKVDANEANSGDLPIQTLYNTNSTSMEHYLKFIKMNSGQSGSSKIKYYLSMDGENWYSDTDWQYVFDGQNSPEVPLYYGLMARTWGGCVFTAYFDYFKVTRYIDAEPVITINPPWEDIAERVDGTPFNEAAAYPLTRTGVSGNLTSDTLTDSTKSWVDNEFAGMYLNPDTDNNTVLFIITGNTGVQIFIDTSGGEDMTSVAASGAVYTIGSPQVDNSITYFKNTLSVPEVWEYSDAGAVLMPWRGYWIFAYENVWVKICNPDTGCP